MKLIIFLVTLTIGVLSTIHALPLTIKLGIVLPFTKSNTAVPAIKARETAIRIAIEEINAHASLIKPDYTLDYVSFDTKSDPGQAITEVCDALSDQLADLQI